MSIQRKRLEPPSAFHQSDTCQWAQITYDMVDSPLSIFSHDSASQLTPTASLAWSCHSAQASSRGLMLMSQVSPLRMTLEGGLQSAHDLVVPRPYRHVLERDHPRCSRSALLSLSTVPSHRARTPFLKRMGRRRRRRHATIFSWGVFPPSILHLRHYMSDCQRCSLPFLFPYHRHQ